MKTFEAPVFEMIELNENDVIVTSPCLRETEEFEPAGGLF